MNEPKKLYVGKSPPELIERLDKFYFNRIEVSKLTGMAITQLNYLCNKRIVYNEYWLIGKNVFYSYANILEIMLVKKIWEHKKPATSIIHARKVLKQLGKNIDCLVNKQILFSNGELFLVEKKNMYSFLISLSKKHGGQLNIQLIDLGEIENEIEENSKKNNIVNFKQRKIIAYMDL